MTVSLSLAAVVGAIFGIAIFILAESLVVSRIARAARRAKSESRAGRIQP
jgi:hypothetical protein